VEGVIEDAYVEFIEKRLDTTCDGLSGRKIFKTAALHIWRMDIPQDAKRVLMSILVRVCADAGEKKKLGEYCENLLLHEKNSCAVFEDRN
jgi:hypothetical protein